MKIVGGSLETKVRSWVKTDIKSILNLSVSKCGREWLRCIQNIAVTSREGRVSRNAVALEYPALALVTSREGRVSRNYLPTCSTAVGSRHVPRVTCE